MESEETLSERRLWQLELKVYMEDQSSFVHIYIAYILQMSMIKAVVQYFRYLKPTVTACRSHPTAKNKN